MARTTSAEELDEYWNKRIQEITRARDNYYNNEFAPRFRKYLANVEGTRRGYDRKTGRYTTYDINDGKNTFPLGVTYEADTALVNGFYNKNGGKYLNENQYDKLFSKVLRSKYDRATREYYAAGGNDWDRLPFEKKALLVDDKYNGIRGPKMTAAIASNSGNWMDNIGVKNPRRSQARRLLAYNIIPENSGDIDRIMRDDSDTLSINHKKPRKLF